MPRQARLDIPGALHHIMVRGINKSVIFKGDEDKSCFLERLGNNVTDGGCAIYAWVIMDNHIHLLFRSGAKGISAVMRRLLTWYAQYFNRRHSRTGHLFENRYKSILCDEEIYLLALVRYIHLNPIRASIVGTIEELDNYPWSGHRVIIGKGKQTWMDTDAVLSAFGEIRQKAIKGYRCFVKEGLEQGLEQNISEGGLVRGLGWSQVLAARRKKQPQETDERVLGSGDFVQAVLKEVEERQLRQLNLRREGQTTEKIIEEECSKAGVGLKELKQGGRRRAVSQARAAIAFRSREELGIPAAEIARHLGVATSSITRTLDRITANKASTQRK